MTDTELDTQMESVDDVLLKRTPYMNSAMHHLVLGFLEGFADQLPGVDKNTFKVEWVRRAPGRFCRLFELKASTHWSEAIVTCRIQVPTNPGDNDGMPLDFTLSWSNGGINPGFVWLPAMVVAEGLEQAVFLYRSYFRDRATFCG